MDEEEIEVKRVITCILTSSPVKMNVWQLRKYFRENEGYDVPYQKFGYSSLSSYLHSLTDKVKVIGNGDYAELVAIVGEKSAHIAELISKQRVTVNNKRKNVKRFSNSPPNYRMMNNQPDYRNYNQFRYFPNPPSLDFRYSTRPNYFTCPTRKPLQRNKFIIADTTSNNEDSTPSSTSQTTRVVNVNTPSQISPSAEVETSTQSDTTSMKSAKDNLSESTTICESLGAIPKSFCSSDFSLYFSDDEVNTKIPEVVQENLRKLIRESPDGIWCTKLPNLYKTQFGSDLDYSKYGYRSLAHMCADIGVFHFVQPELGDTKLFDKSMPIPPGALKFIRRIEYMKMKADFDDVPEPDFNIPDLSTNDVPFEIVSFGEVIPRQWIDADVKVGEYIDVKVAEVYDPSKFWLTLQMHSVELNELMDKMQVFYKNPKLYEIPQFALKEGLYITVVFLKEYHRAKVVCVAGIEKGIVKVYFIDYGTVASVNTTGICYLHKQFSKLPEQAIRGRLGGIYPPIKDEQWSREAGMRFLDLVFNKSLVAQVLQIDSKRQWLEIILIDTSTPDDFFINDELVAEGYALYTTEKRKDPVVSSVKPIVKYIHLFPTFEELETGLLPTFAQMEAIRCADVGVERIYPHYFHFEDELENIDNGLSVSHSYEEDYISEYDESERFESVYENTESWIDLYENEEKSSSVLDIDSKSSNQETLLNNSPKQSPTMTNVSNEFHNVHKSPLQQKTSPGIKSPPDYYSSELHNVQSKSPEPPKTTPVIRPPPGFANVIPVPITQSYVPPTTHYYQQNVYFPNYVYRNFIPQDLYIPRDVYAQNYLASLQHPYNYGNYAYWNYVQNQQNAQAAARNNPYGNFKNKIDITDPTDLEKKPIEQDLIPKSDLKPTIELHKDELDKSKQVVDSSPQKTVNSEKSEEIKNTDEIKEKDIVFQLVRQIELSKIEVHLVKNENEFGFILDEITEILLGKSMPAVQIRKMSIGGSHIISIIDINLRKAHELKSELLSLNLIKDDVTSVNFIALQYVAPLAEILLKKKLHELKKFEYFLKDTTELSKNLYFV